MVFPFLFRAPCFFGTLPGPARRGVFLVFARNKASLGFKHGSLGEDTKGPGKEKPDPSGKAKKTANATNGGHGQQAHGANGALALARQQDANGSQYLPANRSNITEGEFPVVEELTVALPLFLVNVTNATGLIAARNNAPDPNITYRAGNFENDMSFLEDKCPGLNK